MWSSSQARHRVSAGRPRWPLPNRAHTSSSATSSEGAAETVAQLHQLGGEALFVHTDVSDPASVQALVETAVDHFGRPACVFNNAGMLPPTKDLADMSVEEFD